jgi:hypothetical protein
LRQYSDQTQQTTNIGVSDLTPVVASHSDHCYCQSSIAELRVSENHAR